MKNLQVLNLTLRTLVFVSINVLHFLLYFESQNVKFQSSNPYIFYPYKPDQHPFAQTLHLFQSHLYFLLVALPASLLAFFSDNKHLLCANVFFFFFASFTGALLATDFLNFVFPLPTPGFANVCAASLDDKTDFVPKTSAQSCSVTSGVVFNDSKRGLLSLASATAAATLFSLFVFLDALLQNDAAEPSKDNFLVIGKKNTETATEHSLRTLFFPLCVLAATGLAEVMVLNELATYRSSKPSLVLGAIVGLFVAVANHKAFGKPNLGF